MSNGKIIAIIDHENNALNEMLAESMAQVMAETIAPLRQKIEQLSRDVEQLKNCNNRQV